MWELLAQSSSGGDAVGLAAMGMFFMVEMVYLLASYVIFAYAMMTIANRLGVENSWMAWVPILNLYLATQIAELEIMWFIISLICGFAAIYVFWKIAERIGKPGWTAILLCVPCVNLIVPFMWLKEN